MSSLKYPQFSKYCLKREFCKKSDSKISSDSKFTGPLFNLVSSLKKSSVRISNCFLLQIIDCLKEYCLSEAFNKSKKPSSSLLYFSYLLPAGIRIFSSKDPYGFRNLYLCVCLFKYIAS